MPVAGVPNGVIVASLLTLLDGEPVYRHPGFAWH